MYIQIKNNGEITEWRLCNRKLILSLDRHPPDSVVVKIGDFYNNSPDAGVAELPYKVFYALAYEFLVDRQRQEIWERRYRDNRELELLEDAGHQDLINGNVIDDYDLLELQNKVKNALRKLSGLHQRRIHMYYYLGYTQEEIAQFENVSQVAIVYSLSIARKKLKSFLK